MLGKKLAVSPLWSDIDMIIPVPLHWTRKWKRGYNQAEVIARAAAEALGVPVRTDILMRKHRTKTQIKLDIKEKAQNVAGAFAVTEDARAIFRNGGTVRHIVLLDDVFTTGSTLGACFTALRTVFPPSVRISVVTLGYVER
jgi:ComF family protein